MGYYILKNINHALYLTSKICEQHEVLKLLMNIF